VATSAFRVGTWLILPDRCLILDGTREVHLRPRVMDLLVLLAEHAGEVVPHEQILSTVWGKEYLAETALTGAVSELRGAFRVGDQDPGIIETIPKRGYRLVASVSRETDSAPPLPARVNRAPWRDRRAIVGLGLLAAILIAAVLAQRFLSAGRAGEAGRPHRPRVLVLPLESLGEQDEGHMALGITNELTSRLAGVGGLEVIDPGPGSPAAG